MVEHGTLEELPRRAADLAALIEIGEVLNSTLELDELLGVILTGVTAGQGLRFNRAFLLLVDPVQNQLTGRLAVGPDDPDQAGRVWRDLEEARLSLKEMLLTRGLQVAHAPSRVRAIVESIRIPLDDASHVLIRGLSSPSARVVQEHGEDGASGEATAGVLGVDRFALVPIGSRSGPIGVLLADNAITGRPIDPGDLDILRLFAGYAGTAIEKNRLHARLVEERRELETARRELRANHETILRLHRLSDLGEMAARVAHEIRNPLVSIGGFARRMLATTPAADPHRSKLEIIVSEVARLESILREVLDYARPMSLHAVPTRLNDLARESVAAFTPEIDAAGAELALDLDETCPEIVADAGLLKMALLNLLRNSQQAVSVRGLGRRGRIIARTRNLGALVELSVEDNGPGISPGAEDRLFEPFFTTKPSGSGLGLAIVSQIVREHGGRVRVQNMPGEGVVFHLDLPAEKGGAT